MTESFRPPNYEETMHVLFEKETGKVIATERRWTLVRETSPAVQSAHSDLLQRVITGLGRHEDNFDVLVLRGAEAQKPPVSRVDVRLREPVWEGTFHGTTKVGGPLRTEGP